MLTISDGWQLFTASRTLGEPDDDKSSRSDRLRRFGDRGSVQGSPATPVMRVECEADRRRLATGGQQPAPARPDRDGQSCQRLVLRLLRTRGDGARCRASSRAVPEVEHAAARLDSLRLLADGTDGLAVLKRTAVDEALPRIVADASSYYLVTYRSSNPKLDGRFRTLSARVTRSRREGAHAPRLSRSHDRRSAERPPLAGDGPHRGSHSGMASAGRAASLPHSHVVVDGARRRHVLDRRRARLPHAAGARLDCRRHGRRVVLAPTAPSSCRRRLP